MRLGGDRMRDAKVLIFGLTAAFSDGKRQKRNRRIGFACADAYPFDDESPINHQFGECQESRVAFGVFIQPDLRLEFRQSISFSEHRILPSNYSSMGLCERSNTLRTVLARW